MLGKRLCGIGLAIILLISSLLGIVTPTATAAGETFSIGDRVQVVGPGIYNPFCPPETWGLQGCKYSPMVPKSGVGCITPHHEHGWKQGSYVRVLLDSGQAGWYLKKSLRLVEKFELPMVIKSGVWYVVKYGDSLWAIAQKFGTTVEKIVELNGGFPNVDLILAGTRIRVR